MTVLKVDAYTERLARSVSTRFTRSGLFGRGARVALALTGRAGIAGAVMADSAMAAYSPLCGGVCMGSCPAGTNPNSGCWWGCDAATAGCCSGKQRKICDCSTMCSPDCNACSKLPAVYLIGPCIGECCTVCRRVTACSTTSC
jgi:hypothetical protein